MSAEILFGLSIVLLCIGWFFWLRQRRSLALPRWRNILVWSGIIPLTISVLLFALFLFLTLRMEMTNEPFTGRLSILLPIVRVGFLTAVVAVLMCSFARDKSRTCLEAAGATILILWIAQAVGI